MVTRINIVIICKPHLHTHVQCIQVIFTMRFTIDPLYNSHWRCFFHSLVPWINWTDRGSLCWRSTVPVPFTFIISQSFDCPNMESEFETWRSCHLDRLECQDKQRLSAGDVGTWDTLYPVLTCVENLIPSHLQRFLFVQEMLPRIGEQHRFVSSRRWQNEAENQLLCIDISWLIWRSFQPFVPEPLSLCPFLSRHPSSGLST